MLDSDEQYTPPPSSEVVPLVIAGLKKVMPVLPKLLWPLLAPLLGVLADWVLFKSGQIPASSWMLGAMLGSAGVGLREVAKQTASVASGGPVVEPVVTPPTA